MLNTLTSFLEFHSQAVCIRKINSSYWFHLKTNTFSIHKEYDNLEKGSVEFITMAIQAFCQETEKSFLVAEMSPDSKIVFTTRTINFTFSADFNISYCGYCFKDLCKNHEAFYKWQAQLKQFAWAKKSLDIITPDGKSCGRHTFYAEIIPGTNFYFCTVDAIYDDSMKVFMSNNYCFYYSARPRTLAQVYQSFHTHKVAT